MTASSGLAAVPVDGPIGGFGAGVHSQGVPVQAITGGAIGGASILAIISGVRNLLARKSGASLPREL